MKSLLTSARWSLLPALLLVSTHLPAQIPTASAAQDVQTRIAQVRESRRSLQESLEVGPVTLERTVVPVFGRLEARISLTASYANPYDPAEICVDGLVTRPDGRVVSVPGFFYVPYEPKNGRTQLSPGINYRQAGDPGWRLRYAPDLPGEYRLVIQARDAKGTQSRSAPVVFHAEPSTRKGFVKVAASNPMYFENSADGSLFWPVGANVPYTHPGNERDKGAKGPPTYEHYFGQAKGRMNATRVWLCHWAWLEWTPQQATQAWADYGGAGHYNQIIAAALDRVFSLAEEQGLRVMLVTEDNNELMTNEISMGAWCAHPYNQANGGPCKEPADYFSSPEARKLYHNRLRYIAARWGYSDSLWAVNSCNDFSNPGPAHLEWIQQAREVVHRLFQGYRPIIYGTNFRFEANRLADYRQAGRGPVVLDKPNVVQECYYSRDRSSFRDELHEQLWNGLGRGLAGIMVWDHVLVDATGSWDEFLPVMRFAEDLPLHRNAWQPLEITVLAADSDRSGTFFGAAIARAYGDVPDWGAKAPNACFEIDVNESRHWLEGYSPTIFGQRSRGKAWRNPPVFLLNLPAEGKLLIELKEIAGGSNTLLVSRRATEVAPWKLEARVQLDNGRRLVTRKEKWVQLPLDKGPQQIMLDTEGDWVRTESLVVAYPFSRPAALVSASGWSDGRSGFVYLQNQSYSRLLREMLQQPPVKLKNLKLDLAGLRDGRYRVSICSTETGSVQTTRTETSAAGRMALHVPVLSRDAAIRIETID